jgi:glycerol kinase
MEAMQGDARIPIREVRVDGGASVNDALMQFQSDILNIDVVRPKSHESTALGAAYLAGLAIGFWDIDTLKSRWVEDRTFHPNMEAEERDRKYARWLKAVDLSKDWL